MIDHLAARDPGFGVYVHWPFCASKCPYCDFNSHVRSAPIDEPRFVKAFERELDYQKQISGSREVGSIFFGGGTPSLMRADTIGAILDAIARRWTVSPRVEITMEANPTSVEASRLRAYRDVGINRLSLGFQAMNDRDLKALGRLHSADEARAAVKIAASIFDRYSFDLIYARPDQTPKEWADELHEAIALAAEHLSLYQLTIEEGTMFERLVAAGKLKPMADEEQRVLFDITQETCEKLGLPAYEISNHARPGAECRHNLLYWRYGDYVGVGPGAHARLSDASGRHAMSNEKHPETWLSLVETNGHALIDDETLTSRDAANECLLMGLRLNEGLDVIHCEALAGHQFDQTTIHCLMDEHLVESVANNRLRVTSKGKPVLNAIVGALSF